MANTTDFEQALKELEYIVSKLEQGDLALDASLKAYEDGVKLTRKCEQALQLAEQRVQKLVQQDGQTQTVPVELLDSISPDSASDVND